MEEVLRHISINALILAGIFYALFSKVWFSDFLWRGYYQGVYREDFFSMSMKVRSSVIRFVAGVLTGFVVSTIIAVTGISSMKATFELGLLLSVVPSIMSLIQLFYSGRIGRKDVIIEMIFQVISIEVISFTVVLLGINND